MPDKQGFLLVSEMVNFSFMLLGVLFEDIFMDDCIGKAGAEVYQAWERI